ncbi:MAG: hypothetical protein IKH15_06780 [Bacteroidales bacterium]|nr:hypothetical protein [Bacteroidales bacterium]MBR7051633.1 hypothetical protein [Bacteroidaceae bacterium]
MLQKELEERIGRSVTQEEYVLADAAYMACGDEVDKDQFCKMYKDEAGLRDLVDLLSYQVRELRSQLDESRTKSRYANVRLLSISENIRSGLGTAASLDAFIRREMGDNEYLRAKLADSTLTLTHDDREMLTNLL